MILDCVMTIKIENPCSQGIIIIQDEADDLNIVIL